MLLPHMVVKGKVGSIPVQFYCLNLHIKSIEIACASVTCGPGPCTGCPQNGQSRFGTSCTLCRFRAKITWPSVYDPFLGPVKT